MKLKIKYIPKNDCYVALPAQFLQSQNVTLDYTKGQISKVLRARDLSDRVFYFGKNKSF